MVTIAAYHAFLLLVAAHVLGDFLLQTNRMVSGKGSGAWGAFVGHGLVHLVLLLVLLGWAGLSWAGIAVGVAVVHVLIDLGKEGIARRLPEAPTPAAASRRTLALFGWDQLAHVATLLAVTWFLRETGVGDDMPRRFATVDPSISIAPIMAGERVFHEWWVVVWTWVAGLVLATRAGGMVIAMIVAPMLAELERTKPTSEEKDAGFLRTDVRGLQNGGRLIGWLERAMIFLLVMNGSMAGVGFLAAAKSVFRFGELTDPRQRKEAEYILIGTLLSFTWGMFAAWLTSLAIGHVVLASAADVLRIME